MIVYHGSNSRFSHLRIAKSLVKYESTMTNEGMGIYFSTDREVAESYGKYVYTLELNDDYFVDFRKAIECKNFVHYIGNEVARKSGVNIFKYFPMFDMVYRIKNGAQAICNVGHDIAEILDNTEGFYFAYSQTKRESIYRLLRSCDNFKKQPIKAYMFTYHIPNIGVIKDVSDDVVKIINVEAR